MKSIYLFILLDILCIQLSISQSVDETFKEPLLVRPAKIQCIKVLDDEKILLGGDIAFYNGLPANNLIRINPDCTLDGTFSFNGDKSIIIKSIETQSTGSILVLAQKYISLTGVSDFTFYLFQIDSNGEIKKQIDTLKNVSSIAVQDDDKVLVCGGDNISGYLIRYNSDLTPDHIFNHRVSFNRQVTDVKIRDKKLFVAGIFSMVNDTAMNDIVKISQIGYIDPSFDAGTGTEDAIGSLTIQNDGKILIGRSFINSFNGIFCRGMVRLNPDGSVDTGFRPPMLSGMTSDITVKDSSIFLAAHISVNTVSVPHLMKLRPNGQADSSFVPFNIGSHDMFGFCLGIEQSRIIFSNSSRGSRYGLSKCDSAGTLIRTFVPQPGRHGVVSDGDYFREKLIIAGDFTRVNETETYNIALINSDGSVDTSFVLSSDKGKVVQIKILNQDTCLVSTGPSFFKLNGKAQVLPDFNFKPFKTLYNVNKFIVLENGKIISGDPNNIYRLNQNGTEDTTFNIGTGVGGSVSTAFDFDVQGEKIIYGSNFNRFNGTGVNRLIRLKTDASIDQTFDIGSGPDDIVSMIKVLESGEVLVGGFFKYFNGISIPHGIVKLSQNGSINTSFNNNQLKSSFIGTLYARAEQIDSIIFIKSANSVKALNINGTSYDNFNIPFTINQINDIVTINDPENERKSLSAGSKSIMFALGNFEKNNLPSYIVKLNLESAGMSVSPGMLNVSAGANSIATFEIVSTLNWSISCDKSWLTVDKVSGTGNSTITITAAANSLRSERIATLTVSQGGSVFKTIIVTQEANNTGISEINNPVVKIYPSPVTNKLTISFSALSPQTDIVIYTSYGEQVYSSKINVIDSEIDMSLYSPGIYIVKITSMNKVIMTRKIVKQ